MKKKRHVKILTIAISFLVIIILGVLLNIFIVGEPIDGAQVACEISINNQNLELKVTAIESAVALRGWKFAKEGNALHISARKVMVSPFFDHGTFKTSIDLNEIENIFLGGQLIWQKSN
ncbi:MAG: hypothetical protein RR576_06770 [Oscillospiraceae bacterium]